MSNEMDAQLAIGQMLGLGNVRLMSIYDPACFEGDWYWHHPLIGTSGRAVGRTRSEARADIKRQMNWPRVPKGIELHRLEAR